MQMTVREHPPALPPPVPPYERPVPAKTPARPPGSPLRSQLGGIAISLVVLAVGVIGLLDLSGVTVSGGVYLAVPVAVIGAALVVGAWYGRARWLIVPGVVLTVALGIVTAVGSVTTNRQSVTWQPRNVNEVQQTYAVDLGDVVLNLSAVDFSGGSYTVSVENQIGNLTVIVPATVDVRADVRVDVGNADVFGTHWAGIGQDTRTVTDDGADGPGGGTLVIHAATDVGNVEVRR
jgi:hypothetical protein